MKELTKRISVAVLVALMLIATIIVGMQAKETMAISQAITESSGIEELAFTLNAEGTGYKVKALDRQIKQVNIPSEYNGLPVIEVADNGFMSCANLTKAVIPATVTRVGNNAFMNCKNLVSLRGMANTTEIGNNAFALCTKLENLIITPKVAKLGSSIIRNVTNPVYVRATEEKLSALNTNWRASSTAEIIYGNDLTCSAIEEEGEILGYKIDEWQLIDYTDIDVTLKCSYKTETIDEAGGSVENYSPIIEVANDAFSGSSFKTLSIEYDREHIDSKYAIKIGSGAFAAISAEAVAINVAMDITEESADIFSGSIELKRVYLPDSISMITKNMFYACEGLEEIYIGNNEKNALPNTITYIGDNAFSGCTAIENISVPNTMSYIGAEAFFAWGYYNPQTIKIDLVGPKAEWDANWDSGIKEKANIDFNKLRVLFAKEGGTGGSNGVEVQYKADMPTATAPERAHYEFKGYYSEPQGKGKQYYNGQMEGVAQYDKTEASIMYACWEAEEYEVQLDPNGGIGGTEKVKVKYEQEMPAATAPTRTGYEFAGYYSGEGKQYYSTEMGSVSEWDIPTGATLKAEWTNKEYKVTLMGIGEISVLFDKPMPSISMPEKTGYSFKGYYLQENGEGAKYYNEDLSSAQDWNIAENAILYPYWEAKIYKVTLDSQGGGGGTAKVEVIYQEHMPTAIAPSRVGYNFDGYYELPAGEGAKYYDKDMKSESVWNIADAATLYANWNPQKYDVVFEKNGGIGGTGYVQAFFEQEMPMAIAPEKVGETFKGYYLDINNEETKYYDKNMQSVKDWDQPNAATLYAKWEKTKYLVELDTQGGVGGTLLVYANYMMDMPIDVMAPTKEGYIFQGYYTLPAGQGVQYYNIDMESVHLWQELSDGKLYASWKEEKYNITLDVQGGEGGTKSLIVEYQHNMPEGCVAPIRVGYTFAGYYEQANGVGIKYYDENMHGIYPWNSAQAGTIYAYWINVVYEVTLKGYTVVNATYDMPVPTNGLAAPTKTGYTFEGYYDTQGIKYYNADMTSAHVWDKPNDDTLEPKFIVNQYNIKYKIDGALENDNVNHGNATQYTIEDEVLIKNIDYKGYTITWDINKIPRGSIGDKEVVGHPVAITYHIKYELNGGINNSSNPNNFTVEQRIVLRDPYKEYIPFLGWYINDKKVNDLDNIYYDITLVAHWDTSYEIIHLSENESSHEINSNSNMVLLCSDALTNKCTISVSNNVKSLFIVGKPAVTYSMNLNILSRTNEFVLKLKDITIQAPKGTTAINVDSNAVLRLYTIGIVNIFGGEGERPKLLPEMGGSGCDAVKCGLLVIESADNLTIQGGNGNDGLYAKNFNGSGGNGGHAIHITGEYVIINCDNVSLIGGNGGNGTTSFIAGRAPGHKGMGGKSVVSDMSDAKVYCLKDATSVTFIDGIDGKDGTSGVIDIPKPPIIVITPTPINPILPT